MPKYFKVMSQCHQMSFSIRWWRGLAVVLFVEVQHGRNWVAPGRLQAIALFLEWVPHAMHIFYLECDKYQQQSAVTSENNSGSFWVHLFFPFFASPGYLKYWNSVGVAEVFWQVYDVDLTAKLKYNFTCIHHAWNLGISIFIKSWRTSVASGMLNRSCFKSVFSLMDHICFLVWSSIHTDDQALVVWIK